VSNSLWSDFVKNLEPYVPGEQPKNLDLLKLNTNENPYGPSPKALAAIKGALSDDLRLYPPPGADQFKAAIADYYDLMTNQVFVGNGSDEVLAHIFNGLLHHELPVLFPDITYSFYPVYCGLYDIAYETVALDDELCICVDDYRRPNGGIVIANPNAPTGRLLTLAEIEQIVQSNPDSVVVVDEAYIDFGGQSAATLIDQYKNLLVVQTLSKSRSMAGLRLGFAIGNNQLVEALERVKNSFNSYPLDRLAIAGGVAAFADKDYFKDVCARIINTRAMLVEQLLGLGFDVIPSAANFVFVRHPDYEGMDLASRLRDKDIIVRHFSQPRIAQYLRITIGTDRQVTHLVDVLKDIV
jgi:histidinol-phosphate aminotransferase